MLVVGAPLRYRNRIYNTALVIHRGSVLGVVPKSYLPTYREFYERRQLAPGDDVRGSIRIAGADVPFGPDLLFAASDLPNFVLHVEVCEDMWVPIPPSAEAALAGATVLANLSGSPITIGRADERKLLARSASSRCLAAYLYAAGGEGESTTDLAWDGQTMIYENGALLAESERFPKGERRSVADVDTELLRAERIRMGTFDDNRRTPRRAHRRVPAHRVRRRSACRRHRPACATSSGSRSSRRIPNGCNRIATRRTTFRSPGWSSGCARSNYPKVVIGVSGGSRLDARTDRRRPRDGPRRPAAQRHPRVHDAGIRHG